MLSVLPVLVQVLVVGVGRLTSLVVRLPPLSVTTNIYIGRIHGDLTGLSTSNTDLKF